MQAKDRESQIARLKREVEQLADVHAKIMQQRASTASVTVRELDAKRAEILSRRIQRLNEMLDALRSEKAG